MSKANELTTAQLGTPQGLGTQMFTFTTATASGVLEPDTMYRLSADRDIIYSFVPMHSPDKATTHSGCYLAAGNVDYVQTSNSNTVLTFAATPLSVSGLLAASPMEAGTL